MRSGEGGSTEAQGLRDIRIQRRAFWMLLVSSIPLSWITGVLGAPPGAGRIVFWGCIGVWIIVGIWVRFSSCPRCQKLFHYDMKQTNLFTRSCLNCGLRLYGDDDRTTT